MDSGSGIDDGGRIAVRSEFIENTPRSLDLLGPRSAGGRCGWAGIPRAVRPRLLARAALAGKGLGCGNWIEDARAVALHVPAHELLVFSCKAKAAVLTKTLE